MIILAILVFLLLSALFSGTEIAFVSASKLKLELGKQKQTNKGKIISSFYERPDNFIGTLLVGNNIALVVFTILVTSILEEIFRPVITNELVLLLINTLIITLIILIFGEFLPKTIFKHYSVRALFFLSKPLQIIKAILYVPAYAMLKTCDLIILKIFGIKLQSDSDTLTAIDLQHFVEETAQEVEEDIDTELFQRALDFKNVKVKECMVPRTEIVYIEDTQSIDDLAQIFVDSHHSRIVVVQEDIDNILGYVHHQQLLNKPSSIQEVIMPIEYVPEAMRVQDLLKKFIDQRTNLACVVDEYGSVSGIITMEDILEEIFGEIEDEHDVEEYIDRQISEKEYLFSGRLEINYINQKYDHLDFPEGDYQSLSGYLVITTAAIPEQGDVIELDGYRFILEEVSDTKIEVVRVIKTTEENEELAV
ncbi:MAG: hemolysin family protein [Bacteroidia bacterium]|nr:hemolysin family protein [Bacteroidia bacterium]